VSVNRHFPAFFRAGTAGVGAFFAMGQVTVFLTLGSAGFADVGADFADVGRVGTIAGNERHSHVADFGAVAV
jgi:hypothetical protein